MINSRAIPASPGAWKRCWLRCGWSRTSPRYGKREISQSQLARMLGVKQPAIAKLEFGRVKNLELKTLVRYAAALGARVRIAIQKRSPRRRAAAHA